MLNNVVLYQKAHRSVLRWALCGAYEIRTRDLLRDRQAF